jgi:hypothetical protein
MTTIDDVVLAAQQRADRVNASTIPNSEWLSYANASAGELYGLLCSTYQDYNVKSYDFTLQGGSSAQNSIAVGPSTAVPDFFQPRALWLVIAGSPQTPFMPIPRLESLMERHLFTMPNIVPVYGAIPSRWNLLGSTIEILPPTVGANAYRLWYVPTLPTFKGGDGVPLDPFWMTVNGWHEYLVLDVAAKALIKEESLDTANLLLQLKAALKQRILTEAVPRDISQPQAIVDMSRVRDPWSGWGGGMPGPGWGGGDFGGGGNW